MKALEARTTFLQILLLAAGLVAPSALAQVLAPPGPPLPPGAPTFNQNAIARRPAPTNPVANPFALPAVNVPRPPAVPTPLVPQPPVPNAGVVQAFPPRIPPTPPVMTTRPADPNALKWDAEAKEYTSKAGESTAPFTFWLTNVSSSEILINSVRTSCGCTVAKLPSQPWHIPPGGSGPIDVTVNLAGKGGTIAKGVTVDSSVGIKMLTVKVNITPGAAGGVNAMNDTERLKNMQMALADRQVVFKNQECAKCHADPAKGKTIGPQIYAAVCGTCHDSQFRAAMVPDLRHLSHPTDAEHWRKWITYGRPGSMMPAFAQSEGGPLNQQQIDALVEYMVKAYPSRVAQAGQTTVSPSPHPATDLRSVSVLPAPPKVN